MTGTRPCATETDDRLRSLLADPVRRAVVRHFVEHSTGESFDGLARATMADIGASGTADARALRLALHHVHLPKLAAAGVLTYDAGEGRIDPNLTVGSDSDVALALAAMNETLHPMDGAGEDGSERVAAGKRLSVD